MGRGNAEACMWHTKMRLNTSLVWGGWLQVRVGCTFVVCSCAILGSHVEYQVALVANALYAARMGYACLTASLYLWYIALMINGRAFHEPTTARIVKV